MRTPSRRFWTWRRQVHGQLLVLLGTMLVACGTHGSEDSTSNEGATGSGSFGTSQGNASTGPSTGTTMVPGSESSVGAASSDASNDTLTVGSESSETETTGDPNDGLDCDPLFPGDAKDHGVCLSYSCSSSPGSGESCKGVEFAWSDFFDNCVEVETACDVLEFHEVGSSDNLPELPDSLGADQVPTAQCWLEAMRDDRAAVLRLELSPGAFENFSLELQLDGQGRALARESENLGGGYHSHVQSLRALAPAAHYQTCLEGTPSEMLDCILDWHKLACESTEPACDAAYCHGPECMVETWRLAFEHRFYPVLVGSWLYILEACLDSDFDWCGESPQRLSVYRVDGVQEPMLEHTLDMPGATFIRRHETGLLMQTDAGEFATYDLSDPANPEFSRWLESKPATITSAHRIVFGASEVSLFAKDSVDGDSPWAVFPGAYASVIVNTERWLGLRKKSPADVDFFDIKNPHLPELAFTFPVVDDEPFWILSMHGNRIAASFGKDFVLDLYAVNEARALTHTARHHMRNPYVTAGFNEHGNLSVASMRRSPRNFHKDYERWRLEGEPGAPTRLYYFQRDVETAVEQRSGHLYGGISSVWEDADGLVMRDGTELYRLSTAGCPEQ